MQQIAPVRQAPSPEPRRWEALVPRTEQDPRQQMYERRLLSLRLEQAWQKQQMPMSLEQITGTLAENMEVLDGDQDGSFSIQDLLAVAEDENADPRLRRAARALLANANDTNAVDVASGGARADGVFTLEDLQTAQTNEQNSPGGLMSMEQTATVLDQSFGTFDQNQDGSISRDELARVALDENADEVVRKAALTMLSNQNVFNAMDVALTGQRNGNISQREATEAGWGPGQPSDNRWTSTDEEALDRALQQEGTFGDSLITAFDQGSRGNCVSIAVIKAAMDKYGNNVFQNVEKLPDGGYEVTMQDGYVVELTAEEMKLAAQASDFENGDPEAMAYATLCFAAMAKRGMQEGHEGADTFVESLWALTTGEHMSDGANLLGVPFKQIGPGELGDYDSGVLAANGRHSVYVDTSGEPTMDWYGKPTDFQEFEGPVSLIVLL